MILDLRVHWLPLYINDDIIKEGLSPFGHVIDVTRDTTILDKDTITLNGTRLVKLQTTEFDSRHIPHIVSLGQCGMLITMKGRSPICLKCRKSGHSRKDCPEKAASYASVAHNRRSQATQRIITVPEVPAAPAPQATNPIEPQMSGPSVPHSPQAELIDPLELTKEEIDIIVGEPDSDAAILTEGCEKRTELFDVDTLEWTEIRRNKKLKSASTEDDNFMDTSGPKV
ncbi:hypothetical protein ACJMK2_038792 [Sinanodonta woodiana]|uniref:CCHC-type domain-containing protein n=1 Tax=Sinanodonta woodiana TaxID=1069815 RepID=A0ABD3WDC6_SINWO